LSESREERGGEMVSELLLVAAFAALAAPTLYFFLRKPKTAATA
jgi:hypothetical protein